MGIQASFLLGSLGSSGKHSAVIGFNFCGSLVRIAAGKLSAGKVEVTNVASCQLEGLPETDAIGVIKDAVKGFRFRDPFVVISVDSQSIITKNIEIPSISETEIREIIDLQAGRYTPYAREEILIDYVNIDTYHNSYTKVLIVILVQEVIKKQLALLAGSGFKVSRVQLSPELFGAACAKLLGSSTKSSTSIALSVDTKSSDFIVLYKGRTIFLRNIPMGYESFLKERQEFPAKFVDEVKKSLDAYRAEDIEGPPNEVLLGGAPDLVDSVKVPLVENLNMVAKVVVLEGVLSLAPAVKDILLKDRQSSYINAMSALLAFPEARIDLRPSELKMRTAFEEKSREMIKSGALIMAIIVLFCAAMLTKIFYKSQDLKKLNTRLTELAPQVEHLEKASTRVRAVKTYLDYGRQSLRVLSELYSVIPDEIYLKAVAIDEKGSMSLKGTADAMSEVFSFVTALENSKYFEGVSAKNTASRKEDGKDVAEFEITCVVKVP
ncbi:MAG TPA: pilus assembly protein PilM [Patescibacteria group bacterium]|nr:pilus assembly protein PilM [Patescibacteria group bacterium]